MKKIQINSSVAVLTIAHAPSPGGIKNRFELLYHIMLPKPTGKGQIVVLVN